MNVVIFLMVIGAAAGFIATRIMKLQTDIPTTIVIGMGGALIGGFGLRSLAFLAGWLGGLVGAVLGAMALIWFWKTYLSGR
jgi:uncharacterized membrane protein YeaQ/YmgE (transglycosylase-associated protein family)